MGGHGYDRGAARIVTWVALAAPWAAGVAAGRVGNAAWATEAAAGRVGTTGGATESAASAVRAATGSAAQQGFRQWRLGPQQGPRPVQ